MKEKNNLLIHFKNISSKIQCKKIINNNMKFKNNFNNNNIFNCNQKKNISIKIKNKR